MRIPGSSSTANVKTMIFLFDLTGMVEQCNVDPIYVQCPLYSNVGGEFLVITVGLVKLTLLTFVYAARLLLLFSKV